MTSVPTVPVRTAVADAARLGWHRALIELKMFCRERDAVFFTFALPAVLLLLLGTIFNQGQENGVSTAQYLVPSMMAAGIASTTFVNIGIGIAVDRDNGTLRRLRGAPMPPAAYFQGKIGMALVMTTVEIALLLAIGVVGFDLTLPTDPARWLTFAWVLALGVTACALLGVAASSLARSARSAGSVMNLPYLVLSFVSGIYVTPIGALPKPLIVAGSFFPLKWMAQGFRSVFLPDTILNEEVVRSWEHGRSAMVLAAWCVGGLVLCLTTFRWRGPRDG